MLECVVNISEGRNQEILNALASAVRSDLLDIHTDAHHNRSVFTLIGETAPRDLTRESVRLASLATHSGVHPRLGIVDVVPFVPLEGSTMNDAIRARNDFATWASEELDIPCFLYGPERSLPFIRKHAWDALQPDTGHSHAHPTAGAICVGAREPLVAYNVWLENVSLENTKKIASEVRTEQIRTLGLQVGSMTQVSMNLIEPFEVGPHVAYDAVAAHTPIHHAELVGLIPARVLDVIPFDRWEELDLSVEATIEWRLTHV